MQKKVFRIISMLGIFLVIGFLAGCTPRIEDPIDTPNNTSKGEVGAPPENPPEEGPSRSIEGDKYFVTYSEGILSYNLTITLPNPCYKAALESDVIETGNATAKVLLDITTTPPEIGRECAAVESYKSFTGKINFSGEDIEPVLVIVRSDGDKVYTKNLSNMDFEESCAEFGGKWLEKYNECEGVDADIEGFCNKFDGEYNECASACRHETGPIECIEVCIQVCSI